MRNPACIFSGFTSDMRSRSSLAPKLGDGAVNQHVRFLDAFSGKQILLHGAAGNFDAESFLKAENDIKQIEGLGAQIVKQRQIRH